MIDILRNKKVLSLYDIWRNIVVYIVNQLSLIATTCKIKFLSTCSIILKFKKVPNVLDVVHNLTFLSINWISYKHCDHKVCIK